MPVLPKTFNNNRFGKLPLFVVDSEHKCATTAATKNKWTFEDPGDIYIYHQFIYHCVAMIRAMIRLSWVGTALVP